MYNDFNTEYTIFNRIKMSKLYVWIFQKVDTICNYIKYYVQIRGQKLSVKENMRNERMPQGESFTQITCGTIAIKQVI